MIDPATLPLYWRNEIGGSLRKAVETYLTWAVGEGPEPDQEAISAIRDWISKALDFGMDPL